MKKLWLSFLFIVCVLCSNVYARDVNVDLEIYYKLKESAVSLSIYDDKGNGYLCSGIIIMENQYSTGILTAKHCIPDNTDKIFINDKYRATKYIVADDIDVAYVELGESLLRGNPIKISSHNAKRNSYVYYMGYPSPGEKFEIGIVTWSGLKSQNVFMDSIPGCSGSGIVNTNSELVGILWGSGDIYYFNTKMHLVGMTPIEKIKPFLIKLKIWNSILVR